MTYPETGAINRFHFTGASFLVTCVMQIWHRLEHCSIPGQKVACT